MLGLFFVFAIVFIILVFVFLIVSEIFFKHILKKTFSDNAFGFCLIFSVIISGFITGNYAYFTITKTDLSKNMFVKYEAKFKHKQIQSIIIEIYENEEMYKKFRDKFISDIDLDNIKENKDYIVRISNHFIMNNFDKNILLEMFPETEGAKQIKVFQSSKKK